MPLPTRPGKHLVPAGPSRPSIREGKATARTRKPLRAAAKTARQPPKAGHRGHVVAIGASAGGLQSIQTILGGLPRNFPAPVLVVLHLDPDHTSAVAAMLQRGTSLLVKQAVNGEPLRPGRVYVAKPNRHLEVHTNRVRLSSRPPVNFSRPSVDRLFESVASEYGEGAITVVLSGSGSDGSQGTLRAKEQDGTTVAEDRSTAAHPSMPESAIRTGAVDLVLPRDKIAAFLQTCVKGRVTTVPPSQWEDLLTLLRERSGTDFGGYKVATLHRRLEKRILATSQPDLGAYLRVLRRDPKEMERLHNAFLIKVSSFFRDPAAWMELDEKIIRPLARASGAGDEIRGWSAGCATGEEAYSLAILILEALPSGARAGLRVFATDIDEASMDAARHGVYQEAQLVNVSPELRKKYFAPDGPRFRVRKELRRHIIFGRHDLTKDPPIAGLDVLVCRNVLIYLNPEEKDAMFTRFSYAVRPGGALFLGKSESPHEADAMFETLSTRARLYRKTPSRRMPEAPPRAIGAQSRENAAVRAAAREGGREIEERTAFQHMLLQSSTVIMAVVGGDRRITLWNRAAEEFFGSPAEKVIGENLIDAFDGLPAERLNKAVRRGLAESGTVSLPGLPLRREGKRIRTLDLDIIGMSGPAGARTVLVVGTESTAYHDADARQRELAKRLQQSAAEAARSNEALQSLNEELETLNEELQSSSEEQQTLNEELQSSNEELETTNEELQSTNEELNAANDELRRQGDEVERAVGFLRAVLDSSTEAFVACGPDGAISFWSRPAAKLFRLSEPQAMGQEIFALVPALDVPSFRRATQQALEARKTTQVEGIPVGARSLDFVISPVLGRSGEIRGFVLGEARRTLEG